MTEFPDNIVDVLKAAFITIDGVDFVTTAALDPTTATGTVSVAAGRWRPLDWEIGVPEPMGRYEVVVSSIIKHTNQEEGRKKSARIAKKIRLMLYREPSLAVSLAQLVESADGFTERVTRARVSEQDFIDGDIKGQFVFLTLTTMNIDTEIH